MENQHRLIQTYRELTAEEIELINEIKIAEANLLALQKKVELHVAEQYATHTMALNPAELERMNDAEPRRWQSIAKTDFQTGFMALVRAVAQPGPVTVVAVQNA